jgi:hypothetical protein
MMHPTMMEMMAHSKMADTQRAAQRGSVARTRAGGSSRMARPGPARPVAVRRAIGWFLVSVGLRLAVPRRRPVAAL